MVAQIRHTETNYDGLLMAGVERRIARYRVYDAVQRGLAQWR